MNLFLRLLLFGILLVGGGLLSHNSLAQAKYDPKYLREDNKAFRQLTSYTSESGWIEFRQDKDAESIDPDVFYSKYGDAIGLGKEYKMQLISDETDFKEIRHQKYQLYYKNVLVEGVQYYLHSKHKRLNIADGRIVENLDIDVSKPIPEKQALEAALIDQTLTADLFKEKDKLPKGELILARTNDEFVSQNYRYCYAFDIRKDGVTLPKGVSREPYRVYVDAITGQIVRRYPLSHNCFHVETSSPLHTTSSVIGESMPSKLKSGSGAPLTASSFTPLWGGRYGGTQSFETEAFGSGYRLSYQNGALITRRDLNNNDDWSNNADVTNSSTNWDSNYQNATTAHWLTQRVHAFIHTLAQDQNGYDRQGTFPRVLVDLGLGSTSVGSGPQIDAAWNGYGQIHFGFAPLPTTIFEDYRPNTNRALLAADILGHEYMHAVTQSSVPGGLPYGLGEAGALNEGISDIFGTAFERYLFPNAWNWDLGEDAYQIRDMANPRRAFAPFLPQNGQPIRYLDTNNGWLTSGSPSLLAHTNSGVLNKWFHTLYTGDFPAGTHIINGISFDDAISILYRTVRYYLQGGAGYQNIRDATMAAARDLFGGCSPQQRTVMAAWRAANLDYNDNRSCDPDCNFTTSVNSIYTGCNQAITLSAPCNGGSGVSCLNVLYAFSGPNVPYNMGGSSINITTPATGGSYQYSVTLNKPGCYVPTTTFTVNTNCPVQNPCDFSNGPRYVGTWNGLIVQIRQISGHNVLVTAIPNSPTDKYYPRGDNFWGNFTLDPGAVGLQSCLNAGSSAWYGLSMPGGLTPPSGYYQGVEQDGAVFFAQNGTNPVNPCDVSPRHVGTWNGLNVEIRTFPNGLHALVTAIPGSSNDKYYVRGNNFWDNFTKDAGADQYRPCLNVGDTDWWGLTKPSNVSPPSGYQQGTSSDGAIYFSTNGLRVAATEPTAESVSLVQIHPNPVQHEVTVTFLLKEAGDVQLQLLDLQGRVQQKQVYKGIAGRNERILNVSSLATGMYALELVLEQQRIIQKLVKE